MAIKNLSLETIGLHVGYKDYSKITAGQIPYKKPGVLTCSGISIFGDASEVGGLATVTICKPDSQSSFPFTNSLHVQGNSRFVGDASKKPNAVYIDGDLYVSGSTDTGNKGRLAARFGVADALPPKPFDIKHPTKGDGWRLRYVSLEGPESAVFYRGRTRTNEITLPYYWKNLVHADSITVQIQPIGHPQNIIVKEFDNEKIIIDSENTWIDCFYHVYGERKDVNKLIVEYQGEKTKSPNRDLSI